MPPFTYKGTTTHTASENKIHTNVMGKTNNSLIIPADIQKDHETK